MLVLQSNRTFFKNIYLLRFKKRSNIVQSIKIGLFGSIELFLVLPAIVYFIQNVGNLRKGTDSMYGITSFSISFGMYCYFLAKQTSLILVLNDLQEIIDSRSHSPYFKRYQAVEMKISKFTRHFTILITGMCSIVLLMPLFIAFVYLLSGDLRADRLFWPFKVTFPFDRDTVYGFLTGVFIQAMAGWKFCAVFCGINTFYIGVCWYVEICINDIQTFFEDIESLLITYGDHDLWESDIKKYALKRILLKAVNFHIKILSFIEKFANLMDGVIFLTFSIGTIWLSTSLAQYMNLDFNLFQSTVSNILIIVWLFVYCFYGHLISSKCEQVGEFAYHSKFYEYPLALRIYPFFMISRSQRLFFITGYRLTKCSLQNYARFMNTAVSFYMLFRNLSK